MAAIIEIDWMGFTELEVVTNLHVVQNFGLYGYLRIQHKKYMYVLLRK